MSFWGDFVPEIVDLNNNLLIFSNTLPFIKPKTRAIKRIGPHNEDIISVIMGSILGDSYAEKHGEGTRFTFQQEESNMEYLVWFHKFFVERGYCSDIKPKVSTRLSKNGKVRYLYRFRTFTYTSFNPIYSLFYVNKVKVVPKNIEKYLTPLALAVWIMDDGGKVSSGLKIATNSFTFQEVEFLCKVLNNKYGFNCRPNSAGVSNQYIIYFPKNSMNTLSKLVKPYMVNSMYYKLNGY